MISNVVRTSAVTRRLRWAHCQVMCRRSLGSHGDGGCAEEHNLIGPPDPVSNIRPLRFRKPVTRAEEELQRFQLQVWAFNHDFWTRHNIDFQERKRQFVEEALRVKTSTGETAERQKLTANELSQFYKQFLDDKFEAHMQYTKQWLWMNSVLAWLTLKARIHNMFTFQKKSAS